MTTNSIVGTDGVSPLYTPDARWTTWRRSDLYMGGPGANRYVPKEGDLVFDMDQGAQQLVVDSVDPATLIPILSPVVALAGDGEFTDQDMLLGVGPGTQADTYRIYIDKSTTPYSLAVDARLNVAGSMVSTCKIFTGADFNDDTAVISHLYDTQGNITANQIPLELVADVTSSLVSGASGTGLVTSNYALKTVPVCYTMANLLDAEVVTAVFYSDAGKVVSKRQLLVENTGFIRSPSLSTKYITDISLECPFLSTADTTLLQLPINILLSGLNLIGVIEYSDGTTRRLPVDGTKFVMQGMAAYLTTVVGTPANVVLQYFLDPSEISYSSTNVGSRRFLTKTYKLITMDEQGAYNIKLYGYPVWQDSVSGYYMRWMMYNGDRAATYDVTDLVTYSPSAAPFSPLLYGTQQNIVAQLNLYAVNPAFRNYNFTQAVGVTLWGPGTQRTTNWTVQFTPSQNPPYGPNLHATLTLVNVTYNILNLASGFTSLADWLAAVYTPTLPLIGPNETQAPTPNFYRIRFGSFDQYFPINQWNVDMQIQNGLGDSGTVFIEFIYRTSNNDAQLSMAALPVYETGTF